MPSAPSSISSSDPRPGRGLAAACLLLAVAEAAGRAAGVPRAAGPDEERVFRGMAPPDLLLAGDSRIQRVGFDEAAAAYAPPPERATGMVWGMHRGSAPAMLEHLASLRVTPRVLVVGLDPASALMKGFLEEGRQRLATPGFLEVWTGRLRYALAERLLVWPGEPGASLLGHRLAARRGGAPRAPGEADPPLDPAEAREARETGLRSYRGLFAAEPPSREAFEATVSALRTLRGRGARLVLVRLPVSRDLQALEDAWAGTGALERLAAAAGASLVDMNALASCAPLREAAVDGSHVYGTEARRRLSTELGRIAREAAATGTGTPSGR